MDSSSSDPGAAKPEATTPGISKVSLVDDLMRLAKQAPAVRDPRPMDELLDYGPDGLPH
ncbi:MAG: hypothetical protein M3R30_10190 [Candidatus Eremiobacteraeota bacterium]|nr:hypothetical protein [Candidatus Eremiobacteraeota bacterium]